MKGRPAADSRPIFLAALRYPWPPAADHAAEALVALGDKGVISALVTLLKEPDPAAPRKLPRGGHVVQEVVRTNHRANCLLCHPPALTGNEPVQGQDPVNTVPARSAGSGAAGGGAWSGGGSGGGGGGKNRVPLVIRADITFLRQDFSVQLPAANLPPVQGAIPSLRFDFFVRSRRLTKSEARPNQPRGEATYPQREAVLFALRELTGRDAGSATEDWVRLFPTAQIEVDADRLAEKLVAAGPVRLAQLLGPARGGEEEVRIKGLATALPRLKGEARDKVQEALIQQLARLDADGLRRRLHEEAPVLRQAAVSACVRRGDKELIPDLIALLEEADPMLTSQAEKGLEVMTGQHFANPTAWREWWESGKQK